MCVVCAAEVKVNLFPVHSGYLVSMQIVASEVSGSTNRLFKHNSVRSAFERRTCAWRAFAWRLVIIQRGRLYRGCITIFSSGADRRQQRDVGLCQMDCTHPSSSWTFTIFPTNQWEKIQIRCKKAKKLPILRSFPKNTSRQYLGCPSPHPYYY